MAFHSQMRETKVEIFTPFNDGDVDTDPVKDILHVIRFSSWLGLLPVKFSARKGQGFDLRFVGWQLVLLVSLMTFVFQLLYAIQISHRLLKGSSDATNKVVVMLDYLCFFVSAIIVPRITLWSLSSLRIALARLLNVHELCSDPIRDPRLSSKLKPPYVQYMIAVTSFWVQARRSSTHFFLGEACAWLGFIIYPVPKIYSVLATWIVPLQLFTLCRSLARSFSDFGEQMHLVFDQNFETFGATRNVPNTSRSRLHRLEKVLVNLMEATEAVEAYFWLPMLLFVSSRLVNLIRDAYMLFIRLREIHLLPSNYVGALSQLLNASNDLASFLFVVHAAEVLQASVMGNKRRMRKYVYNDTTCHDGFQLHWFRQQVLGIKVNITGCGMFVVGKSMIPPLLGVIATYFFLILQISAGEK